ncbi:MAG: OPT family oligopeptide transporter [Polyangiales bacterium]
MSSPAGGPAGDAFPEPDWNAPQLTLRSIGTGMLLGALLAPCNIYSGLKIGWSFNMSVAAALISYALWNGLHRTAGTRYWGLLENNINQTSASAGASIASAGLVAPIPALTMLTGRELAWAWLVVWVLCVSLIGVVVAVGLRRQMLVVDRLPFPAGIATAETIKEVYGRGTEAMARVRVLVTGGIVAGLLKLFSSYVVKIPKLALPGGYTSGKAGSVSLNNLGFALDPSLLMVGFGAIIGIRAGASLMLGAVLSWGVVGPWALEMGWAHAGEPGKPWYGEMLEWLLWPGVAMMVTASITSFAFSWRSIGAAMLGVRSKGGGGAPDPAKTGDVPRLWFLLGLLGAGAFAVVAQWGLFEIALWTAAVGVLLTFVLAIVAGRVSGETGITPIGAMGKVTQLMFGGLDPGSPASNLMAANVTGGAAGQCADMLHDLKTGLLVGAVPRLQAFAQLFGVLAGALAGSAAYLVLVPNPSEMLLTEQWPAPAVATWKAVAEVFMQGFDVMPEGSVSAMIVAGGAGILLAVLEKTLSPRHAEWVPSPASIGLAFVIPAWNSISMFLGALVALLLGRFAKSWADRFVVVLAAGLVAGESLAGVVSAIEGVLTQ